MELPGALAVTGAEGWPVVQLRTARPSGPPPPLGVQEHSAQIGMPQGTIAVDRRERTAVIETAEPLEPAELVHPYLWPVASVLARWQGHETFHAGAVVSGDGAWAVLGDRGDGKTSLLAWLNRRAGLPVLTDDLLVAHGQDVYAGPRCLDLRVEAAERLGIEGSIVRATLRRRLSLPPIHGRLAFRGWIFLEWGSPTAIEAVPPAARLSRLAPFRRAPGMGTDGVAWLSLIGLPTLVLRRPRRWESMEEAGALLLERLPGGGDGRPRTGDGSDPSNRRTAPTCQS